MIPVSLQEIYSEKTLRAMQAISTAGSFAAKHFHLKGLGHEIYNQIVQVRICWIRQVYARLTSNPIGSSTKAWSISSKGIALLPRQLEGVAGMGRPWSRLATGSVADSGRQVLGGPGQRL